MVLEIVKKLHNLFLESCLNPCLGGIWSWRTKQEEVKQEAKLSLNPCLGGIWSWRVLKMSLNSSLTVLILVWVEYGLGVMKKNFLLNAFSCLNPCLGGIWSWSA